MYGSPPRFPEEEKEVLRAWLPYVVNPPFPCGIGNFLSCLGFYDLDSGSELGLHMPFGPYLNTRGALPFSVISLFFIYGCPGGYI